MRYIRFLKTPRVVVEKGTQRKQISCLITVTSDLGDSFLPYDVQLSAELLSSKPADQVIAWKDIQWTAGMRSLSVTFPLITGLKSSGFRIKIGVEPKSTHDEYSKLSDEGTCGVVSAWTSEFDPFPKTDHAEKLVERRFKLPNGPDITICEETGESIARHLWDAGITLSCHVTKLLERNSSFARALLPSEPSTRLQILELGTGCGMVGIAIAQIIKDADIHLTDLPEAREIVQRNLSLAHLAEGSTLAFQELDWEDEIPTNIKTSRLDMVVAADCTYNSDSSPALVDTLLRLAKTSQDLKVAIAMKMRHSSEDVFFDLMAAAGFEETAKFEYPLPGDTEVGEETVHLHVYQYNKSS